MGILVYLVSLGDNIGHATVPRQKSSSLLNGKYNLKRYW